MKASVTTSISKSDNFVIDPGSTSPSCQLWETSSEKSGQSSQSAQRQSVGWGGPLPFVRDDWLGFDDGRGFTLASAWLICRLWIP